MLGFVVIVEAVFPRNPFKKLRVFTSVDMEIAENCKITDLAKKHGAQWRQGYYSEEGTGFPIWFSENDEDNLEKCWNFLTDYKEMILASSEKS
jgi:hypothetical protein